MIKAPNRLEEHRTLYYSNIDFAFATTLLNTITKTLMAGLIVLLRGSEVWINVAFAIPNLMGLAQIPGTLLARSFYSYKPIVFWGQFFWRAMHLPIMVLPLLWISSDLKLAILLFCMALGAIGFHFSTPILNEWIAEIVPHKSRGWFFSMRNAIAAGVAAFIGIAAGFIIDYFRTSNQEELGFTIVFGLIIGSSLLGMLSYRRMADIPRKNVSKENFLTAFKALEAPLRDSNFRKVLYFIGIFSAGMTFGGNLFFTFGLKHLQIPYTILQTTIITEAIGFFIGAKIWGYLSDKYGNKPVLVLIICGLFFSPAVWMFCQPGNTVLNAALLLPGYIFSGAFWGGALTCQLNLILSCAKPEERTSYIGLGLAVQYTVGAIAPICAGFLANYMVQVIDPIFAFKYFFGIVMFVRLISLFFVTRFTEEGSEKIVTTLQQIKSVSPKGFRAFRKLSEGKSFETRASAIESVGSTRLTLATVEIIQALHDPSPRVRHQATVTLGTIGTSEVVDHLIEQFEKHPDFIDEEGIRALSKLKSNRATPIFVQLLDHPRFSLRYAAVKALGRLGDKNAIPALVQTADKYSDTDLKTAIIQALRELRALDAKDIILQSLVARAPNIRIAAAEAVGDLKIAEARERLIESLELYQDEASSEIAYALGSIGSLEDAEIILRHAREFSSQMARRRSLLGVAGIFGVEFEFYRLILLDGMNLERAILEKLGSRLEKSGKLKEAVTLYFAGNEDEALGLLESYTRTKKSELKICANNPVEELFLLALCLIGKN